jgi:hypothetical protein
VHKFVNKIARGELKGKEKSDSYRRFPRELAQPKQEFQMNTFRSKNNEFLFLDQEKPEAKQGEDRVGVPPVESSCGR